MIANMDKLRTNRLKVKLILWSWQNSLKGGGGVSCLEYSKHLQIVSPLLWSLIRALECIVGKGQKRLLLVHKTFAEVVNFFLGK